MVNNKKKNLSEYDPNDIPPASDLIFGIIVSDWNSEITYSLLDGAVKTLKKHGADEENIVNFNRQNKVNTLIFVKTITQGLEFFLELAQPEMMGKIPAANQTNPFPFSPLSNMF